MVNFTKPKPNATLIMLACLQQALDARVAECDAAKAAYLRKPTPEGLAELERIVHRTAGMFDCAQMARDYYTAAIERGAV